MALAATIVFAACRSSEPARIDAPLALSNGGTRVLSLADVDERWRPALEALRAAVDAGDDAAARGVLARLLALGPEEGALEMALAYEKILDGRALVHEFDLAIEAEFQRTESTGAIVVWFRASSADPRQVDVAPGPGSLEVTTTTVNADGDETRSLDVLPVATPLRFLVSADAPVRIPIAHMPFGAPRGSFATRARFELSLRSGALFVDERELPAQRWHVASGEVVLLARELASLELAGPDALLSLVADGKCEAREALALAVRVPPSQRPAALDLLAGHVRELSEPALLALAPALRWLAPEENLGRDAGAWRAYLRRRSSGNETRPNLILPSPRRSEIAGP